MEIKDLLPVGSVVRLFEGEKRLIICGIKQTDANNLAKEYDYMGLLYPEGHIGEDYQYLFNHSDIEEIIFKGYSDDERDEFLEKLSSLYSNHAKRQ